MINNQSPVISRRGLLGLLGAAGIGTVLAGCAGPGSTAGRNEPTGVATGAAEGEVSFAHWRAEDKAAFEKLIATFKGEFPDITVTQDISPANDYQTQALNRLRGGAAGDVFPTFRGAQFTQFVKGGVYTDLTTQDVVKNYNAELIEAGKADGKQYGLPYQVVFPMPVANMDLLGKVGVDTAPTDWDGFLSMCDKLKSSGITPLAWPGGEVGNAGQLFNNMIMNEQPADDACAQIEAGKMKVTDDWFIGMLNKYVELRPYFQANAVGTAVEPTQQLFASEKAAMLATGSYHIAAVRALGAKFPIALVPPITTSGGTPKYEGTYNATFILGINAKSKVQPAALEWLKFLSNPTHAGTYANETVQHVTVAGVDYSNPDLKTLAPWLEKNTLLAPRFQFEDLDIRNAAEGCCIQVVGGTEPAAAAQKAQAVIDQKQ
jgi:raffinose/stachyose/melibiose transport system substrate-binding protein